MSRLLGGRISFLPQSLPVKIIVTYLIRVFDTTWESKFWALKFLFLGQLLIFHFDLKAIKAFDPVKKVSVLYLLRILRKFDALVSVKCADIYIYIYILMGYPETV